jgi:hypothetical protein
MRCKYPTYIITSEENTVTRFTESKLYYDENNHGRLSATVHLAKTLMQAVAHAKKNYSGWAFFISPGQVFLQGFWREFDYFVGKNPGVSLIGHIMPEGEPVLHNQAIALDVSKFQSVLPLHGVNRSAKLNSRNYPESVVSAGTVSYEQDLCVYAVSNGYSAINWPDCLREHKLHWYPAMQTDLRNSLSTQTQIGQLPAGPHQKVLESALGAQHRNKKILWVVNNYVWDKINITASDKVLCPASGLFWLACESANVTVFDYNETQLDFARDLYNSKPQDVATWIYNWIQSHDCYPNLMHNAEFSPADIALNIQGLKLNFDKNVDFKVLDIVSDFKSLDKYAGYKIWLSNILEYEPNIVNYGLANMAQVVQELESYGLTVIKDNMEYKHGWI